MRGSLIIWMLLLGVSMALACQSSMPRQQLPEDQFWSAVRSTEQKTRTPPKNAGGEIPRHELLLFLERGPAAFLSQVPVTPILDGSELVGYRLEAFFERDVRFSNVDIAPGDVVTSVNGSKLARPDEFFAVWEQLAQAPRLQIDVIRGKTLRTLTWEIVDDETASRAVRDSSPTVQ